MTKVLLVEDASDLAHVIVRELESAGFETLHAEDGLTALQLHAHHQPDAIILDWMLPGLDGLSVLEQIRRFSATPVLMLTARNEEDDRVAGLQAGADDYLTKPFSMRELVARVEALLRRVELMRQMLEADQEEPLDSILCGLIALDPDAHLVTIDGDSVDLSRTEFNLLHLLMRNQERTFSRDYLLDAVWGETFAPGDRAVDNVIARIRKKLGEHGDAIEARWGVGYRWRRD